MIAGPTVCRTDRIPHESLSHLKENRMSKVVLNNLGRREFLRAVPAGAAAGFTIANLSLFDPVAHAQGQSAADPQSAGGVASFQLFTAQEIQNDAKALEASPGNDNLVQGKNFTVVLTVETAKTGAEFEWHEGRDHVFQILDGETIYEVGGTPKGAHSIGPGEWQAPQAEGTTKFTLKKGDMLVVPRGTLHKRSTAGTVTFTLISPQGVASAKTPIA
jgi:mannose-6-phosphate isomerase-like protein (cupin superfamily)